MHRYAEARQEATSAQRGSIERPTCGSDWHAPAAAHLVDGQAGPAALSCTQAWKCSRGGPDCTCSTRGGALPVALPPACRQPPIRAPPACRHPAIRAPPACRHPAIRAPPACRHPWLQHRSAMLLLSCSLAHTLGGISDKVIVVPAACQKKQCLTPFHCWQPWRWCNDTVLARAISASSVTRGHVMHGDIATACCSIFAEGCSKTQG